MVPSFAVFFHLKMNIGMGWRPKELRFPTSGRKIENGEIAAEQWDMDFRILGVDFDSLVFGHRKTAELDETMMRINQVREEA